MDLGSPVPVHAARWNNEKTTSLIGLFELNPCLWNPKHVGYRNNQFRNTALEEVAAQMGNEFSITEIKDRFRTMKTVFKKVHKKVKAAKMGDSKDPFYLPKWTFYSRLMFLRTIIESPDLSQEDPEYCDNFVPLSMIPDGYDEKPEKCSNNNSWVFAPSKRSPSSQQQQQSSSGSASSATTTGLKTIEKIIKRLKRENDNGAIDSVPVLHHQLPTAQPIAQPTQQQSAQHSQTSARKKPDPKVTATNSNNVAASKSSEQSETVEVKRIGDRFEKFGEFVAESARMLGPCSDLAMLEIQQVLVKYKYGGTAAALGSGSSNSNANGNSSNNNHHYSNNTNGTLRTPSPQMSSASE